MQANKAIAAKGLLHHSFPFWGSTYYCRIWSRKKNRLIQAIRTANAMKTVLGNQMRLQNFVALPKNSAASSECCELCTRQA